MSKFDILNSFFYESTPFDYLIEGGNASVDGIQADKIDIEIYDREFLTDTLFKLFAVINDRYKKQYQESLWDTKLITNHEIYNGSSKFLFSKDISDEDYKKYKKLTGDIDVVVDRTKIKNLLQLLKTYKGKLISDNCTLLGTTKDDIKSEDGQVHAIFKMNKDGSEVNVQVDFEGSTFEKNQPTEFTKFSHSSNWEDIKDGYKGVAHKFLLRALCNASKQIRDFVILTPSSTYDNIKISNSKSTSHPSFLSFSVAKGIRNKFVPVLDANGKQLVLNGKKAYKEDTDTSDSKYVKDIDVMFMTIFGKRPLEGECGLNGKFSSFKGLIELIDKYKSSDVKEKIIESLIGGIMEQALERNDPDADRNIKFPILGALMAKFKSPKGKVIPFNEQTKEKVKDSNGYACFKMNGKDFIVKFDEPTTKHFEDYYSNYRVEDGEVFDV